MDATLSLAGKVPQPLHSAPVSGMWLSMPLSQRKGSVQALPLLRKQIPHPSSLSPQHVVPALI